MKRISSNSVSEYTDYFRYILTIVLVFFILCCEAVFVFAATQQKTPERIAFFPVLAIVTGMALAIFAYQNFTHVTVNTIINSEGLHSSRFGRELKELNWDDVKDVVCAKFTFSGYTACVTERYLMFAGHKLSTKEKKDPIALAGNINDVIVVKYTEELMNSIREFHAIEIDFAE